MRLNFFISAVLLVSLLSVQSNCSKDKNTNPGGNNSNPDGVSISSWITKGDKSALLQKQTDQRFGTVNNSYQFIDVDTAQRFQLIDGFGYTLTGGSAYLINKMSSAERSSLLQELFGSNENSISVSFLRVSIGSSDLNASVFSYDDMPAGQSDVNLTQFSLLQDTIDLIPV